MIMNKRIQELYDKCWITGSYQEPVLNDDIGVFGDEQRYRTVKTHNFSHEKFSKLIVRECVDIAHVHSAGSEPHDEGRVYYYSEDIADKIKQHFGITE